MEDDVVIVAATRTAVGKFGGALAKIPAAELGAKVIKSLLQKTGLKPDQVSEVIMGQVLTAGDGQNPARQAVARGWAPRYGARHDDRQGVRQRSQGRSSRDAGDQVRRRRHHYRRRPGKHERFGARIERLPRRFPHGRREAGRHDDRRRPVGCLQPVPHGHYGGKHREKVRSVPCRSRMLSQPPRRTRPRPRRKPGKFKEEITPVEIPSKKGTTVFDTDEFVKHGVTLSLWGL